MVELHENYKNFNIRIGDIVHCFRKPKEEERGHDWWNGIKMDCLVGHSGRVISIDDKYEYGPLVAFDVQPNELQGGWYVPYTCLKIVR